MVSQEELQDLKGVWAELSKIWQQIDELKERPWMSVQPRKVCSSSIAQLKTKSCYDINNQSGCSYGYGHEQRTSENATFQQAANV